MAGNTYGVSDGYGCCLSGTTLVDQMQSSGLTWQAYCESGCPRGNDHFPFAGFSSDANSPNIFTGSSVSTSALISSANSASPPNLLWYTPTDNHNMHDNSIQTGDSYLQQFLVGSGTVSSPASGSLLASSLFTSSLYRTQLWIWWDEYDPSPNIEYGSMIHHGFISTSNSWDEYSQLRMMENNWGLSPLGYAASASTMTDIFGSNKLSANFNYLPATPVASVPVSFTGAASGGTLPYTYSWKFGDGSTGTGVAATHTYTASGSYSVTLTVKDSASGTANFTQAVQISPVSSLIADFQYSPSSPTSGQSITFTGSGTGGVSPYVFSWSFGDGSTSTSQSPIHTYTSSGSFTVNLHVTDSLGTVATRSQSLIVQPSSKSGSAPVLIGWGAVGLGESLTDIQSEMQSLNQSGYNIVRVDFEPTCTTPPDRGILGSYDPTKMGQVIALAKQYNLWIIIDYHGYTDLQSSSGQQCWLGFWKSLAANFTSSYSQIIWEPINEPQMASNTDVAGLSSAYQAVINEVRAMGDTHWIVVQNLCSSSCGFGDTNMAAGYPSVNDTAGRVFISLHSYMAYQYYSSSWNNATADTLAQDFYNAVVTGMTTTGWPILNTEGGADPIAGNCSGGVNLPSSLCAPDQVLVGSAGYSIVTFHFIQTLTNLYDANAPQRINWVWWPMGSWTDTPGAGTLGALQCNSNPIGWGCLLTFVPVGPRTPDFAISATSPSALNTGQSGITTITITGLNGFAAAVALTDSVPNGLNCGNISNASLIGSGTATILCSSSSASTYTLTVTGTSGSLTHTATTTFTFQDFTLSANPSSLSINAGGQATSTVGLNLLNGFRSTVALTVISPTGVTASLGVTTISGSGTSTLTISPTTAGSYSIVVTGNSGSLTRTVKLTLSVGAQVSPVLTAPTTERVIQTSTVTFSVTATDANVPTPTLTLSANQLPSDATFTTVQGSSPVSGTFSWTPTNADAPGTYDVSFTVTDGISSAQTYVIITVVSANVLPLLTVPGPLNATVGTSLHFAVSATDPTGTGGTVVLSASGLAPYMAFDPVTGVFSFTPSSGQAGGSYMVRFTGTDSNDPTLTRTQSVPIHVLGSSAQPSGGGFCLSCLLPRGMTTSAWLLTIGTLVGIISAIALLHMRAAAELATARRRMKSLNAQRQVSQTYNSQGRRKIAARDYERRRMAEHEQSGE